MIEIRLVANIFEPEDELISRIPYRPGLRIRDIAPTGFDLAGGHAILCNDHALSGDEVDAMELQDGDHLVFGIVPGVFEAILGAGLLVSILDTALLIGISLAISYAIVSLTSPKNPIGKGQKEIDGPARNWEGIQDTAGNGKPIQFIYGKVRTGGHFLQSFERQITGAQVQDGITTLHTLLGLGLGPMESISDCQINGNEISTIPDVTQEIRLGTSDQANIPGFSEISHEIITQVPLIQKDDWYTYITRHEVDAIDIVLRFPAGLFRVSTGGIMHQVDVDFEIQIRRYGRGIMYGDQFLTKKVSTVGRNPIKAMLRVEGLTKGLYEVRIKRMTTDDEDRTGTSQLQYVTTSELYAVSEIIIEEQAHPGIAMVGLKQIPSEQVNAAVPTTYTFLVKGFNDVRIYSSLTMYTVGWSDNPAWCCAHFLTSPIHGLGDKYTWANIDMASFLAWAAYCDELVDRGDGVLEKRATFNHVFDTVNPADEALEIFVQGSGAALVKRGNLWRVILDRADSMVWVAGEGNIFPGTLRLTYLPKQQLANRIQAMYSNEEEDYQRDSWFDELPGLLPGEPYVEANRELWGVTRPSQVAREVRRLLLHNLCATTQVELEAGLDAFQVCAGSIFGVSLPTTAVGIASGRILAVDSTLSELTLDESVTLEAGKTYEIVVQHGGGEITSKRLVSPPGVYEHITVSDVTWSGTIAAGNTYALGEIGYSVEKFRCIETSLSGDFRRKIRGLKYDPAVYTDQLDTVPGSVQASIPDPRRLPPEIQDLTLFERQEFSADGTLREIIDVDWTAPVSSILDFYEIWIRAGDGIGWVLAGTSKIGHFEITHGILTPGYLYEITVVSVSSNGARTSPGSAPRSAILTQGLMAQPSTPSNLIVSIIDGTLIATVDPLPDDELGPSGYYEWRSGFTWNQSQLLERNRSPRLEVRSYTHGFATILVRSYNSIGNQSAGVASSSITLYGQVEENIVLSQDEYPFWTGTRIGFVIEGGTNMLTLIQPGAARVAPKRQRHRRASRRIGWGSPPAAVVTVPEGWYTSTIITVASGALVRARPDIAVVTEAIYINLGDFASSTFAFDSAKAAIPFSGLEADKISVLVQSRFSMTGSDEASFSAWADHRDRGEISLKYFQFRIKVTCESSAYSAKISSLLLTIDLPDKTFSGQVTVASANPVTTNYPTNYFANVKRLVASVIGGAIGDTLRITSQDAASFTAELRTSAGALTTGAFHYEARGY